MVQVRDIVLTRSENFPSRNQRNIEYEGISIRKKVTFGPNNTVDGLARGASDGANWITFWSFFGVAIVAFGFTLLRMSLDKSG